jgi:RNA polymerase sigma-70 factor (ECF subfamily)
VRDEQVAEDLISEIFLDMWLQAGKFEGRSAVSTWVLVIRRFKALSALRVEKTPNWTIGSVEEVAEIVGIPENTVKRRLFHPRKKLAALLKAAGIERGWL